MSDSVYGMSAELTDAHGTVLQALEHEFIVEDIDLAIQFAWQHAVRELQPMVNQSVRMRAVEKIRDVNTPGDGRLQAALLFWSDSAQDSGWVCKTWHSDGKATTKNIDDLPRHAGIDLLHNWMASYVSGEGVPCEPDDVAANDKEVGGWACWQRDTEKTLLSVSVHWDSRPDTEGWGALCQWSDGTEETPDVCDLPRHASFDDLRKRVSHMVLRRVPHGSACCDADISGHDKTDGGWARWERKQAT